MSLRFCILGSGSSGNSTLIATENTRILIDAGFSGRETARRLALIDVAVDSIDAICLTHEHSDHTTGLRTLCTRHSIIPFANSGTIESYRTSNTNDPLQWQIFTTGAPFRIGDLDVEPFVVPHDAFEPVGFLVSSGDTTIGIVTDMGTTTHLIREKLRKCQALIVESNHDERLLEQANRPWHLKQRIAGRQGHLSNSKAAEMIAEIAGSHLTHVYLSHLSKDCNKPDLALKNMQRILSGPDRAHIRVCLSYPDRISEVWESTSTPPQPSRARQNP